jgi:hypothetical protein
LYYETLTLLTDLFFAIRKKDWDLLEPNIGRMTMFLSAVVGLRISAG